MLAATIGSVTGPVFAGYIVDVTDSYRIAFYSFIVLIPLSSLAFLFARPPKPPAAQPVHAGS